MQRTIALRDKLSVINHKRRASVRTLRLLCAHALALLLALPLVVSAGHSETNKIRVGKIISGSGFHIPTYIAMDHGFFKQEGLDATWVELTGRALVTATLSGNADFAPIPSGGAQAALRGAKIKYVVGESLRSQWVIVVPKSITKVQDLRGKTLGYGRQGAADYDEGAAVLRRAFKMEVGKDYKVISFQGESDRIAALINGDIQGALISIPHAVKAESAGMHILIRTGDYIPRAGGAVWTMEKFVNDNPQTTKKFIRAIAKAVTYFRANKEGSVKTLKSYMGIKSDAEAGAVWEQLKDAFGAELPPDLFAEIIQSRVQTMKAARQWPEGKPAPDPEQFVTRQLLDSTLKEMNYVPTKLEAPKAN
jgi:ABC-type nitrate/sulfonate/bicarbonate transport system substrate-binding protein